MAGSKYDEGKQQWHSLPLEILEPLADLMEAGCKKYGKFNCLENFDNPDERFWNANMRHAAACQRDPLAIDPETGCYHEAARAFSSLMRIYHCRREAVRKESGEGAADYSGSVLCPSCNRRWPLGSEQGRSVSATGRCIVCRADEDRATYTVPPPQDGDDDPIVHVVSDRTSRSGEVEASASTKRKYAEPITWLPCPND